MEGEDVVGTEIAEERRDLVAEAREHRGDQHHRDDANHDPDDGERRPRGFVRSASTASASDSQSASSHARRSRAGRHRDQSALMAVTMSSCVARRAGYQPATSPLTAEAARLQTTVDRPHVRGDARRAGDDRDERGRQGEPREAAADGEQQRFGEHLAQHLPACRAECAADADVARPLADGHQHGVRHDHHRREQRDERDRDRRDADALGEPGHESARGLGREQVEGVLDRPARSWRRARIAVRVSASASSFECPSPAMAKTCSVRGAPNVRSKAGSGIQT